jgi:hypothetical protein
MQRITDDHKVLHILPVWFYQNHLKDVEGKYVARPVGKQWYVKVRTQYTGSSTLLKEVRSIRSEFMLST